MPRTPTELDTVEHHLQNALEAIRLMPCGAVGLEQLKTAIYKDICEGVTKCVDYAYGHLPHKPPLAPTATPSKPKGGGVGRGLPRSKQDGGPKTWTFAADLDLLK